MDFDSYFFNCSNSVKFRNAIQIMLPVHGCYISVLPVYNMYFNLCGNLHNCNTLNEKTRKENKLWHSCRRLKGNDPGSKNVSGCKNPT